MGLFFRFVAVVLLALALMAFGADAIASLEKGDMVMRSMTKHLGLFGADPTTWIETTLPSYVNGVLDTIMSWPAWATLGVVGLVIGALSFGRPEDEYDPDTIRDDMRSDSYDGD
jgi:hypothetical protein